MKLKYKTKKGRVWLPIKVFRYVDDSIHCSVSQPRTMIQNVVWNSVSWLIWNNAFTWIRDSVRETLK